jgi:Tfp pilus assembly protein PilF
MAQLLAEMALKVEPDSAPAAGVSALALHGMNHQKEAQETIRKALVKCPEDAFLKAVAEVVK